MAVLESIRKRTWLLLTVVTAALLLFIIQAVLDGDRNNSGAVSEFAGKIGDKEVSTQEYNSLFEKKRSEQRNYYARQGQQMPQYVDNQVKSQSWEELIEKYGYAPVFEESGLLVTDAEKKDLVNGTTISENVKSQFLDGNGNFSMDTMEVRLENLLEQAGDEGRQRWNDFMSYIINDRFRQKYTNALTKTDYVTQVEAKNFYFAENSKVTFDYVYVPFASMPDSASGLEVSDAEMKTYLTDNINEFDIKNGRVVKYVMYEVKPSSSDSAKALKLASTIATDFRTAKNDTAFYKIKSDKPTTPRIVYMDELSGDLKLDSGYLKPGFVKGPVLTFNGYEIDKVIGMEPVERAQTAHVLIKFGSDSAKAKETALEVLRKARAGQNFGKLAEKYSEDEGSKDNDGKYELTRRGKWVKPFENAVFDAENIGVLPDLVETQYGYHVMKVLRTKFSTDEPVMVKITKEIRPSQTTINKIYADANTFVDGVDSKQEFVEKVELDESKKLEESPLLTRSSTSLGSAYNAGSVVAWAFNSEREEGDVSNVISIGTGTKYVIATLTRITDKENPTIEDVRDELQTKVKEEKKGKLLKQLLESTEGDLNERADKINTDNGAGYAKFGNVVDHAFSSNYISGVGNEPEIVGTAFSMEPEDRFSKTLIGTSGVYIVRVNSKVLAPDVADYTASQEKVKKTISTNVSTALSTAVKTYLKVEDNRL